MEKGFDLVGDIDHGSESGVAYGIVYACVILDSTLLRRQKLYLLSQRCGFISVMPSHYPFEILS